MNNALKIKFLLDDSQPELDLSSTGSLGYNGMRHRMFLPEESGLFFEFATEGFHYFWMQDVRVPLDVIFINSNLEVVDIFYDAQPFDKTPFTSKKEFTFAVETKTNWAKENKVEIGSSVEFLGWMVKSNNSRWK